MSVMQSSQFFIKKLSIVSRDETIEYDISGVYTELNIHDNLQFPCMSGSILITDAVGLSEKIKFDGSEFLWVKIQKDKDDDQLMWIDKKFVIYAQTNRTKLNQTSESYILNFVSEEFVLSEQKKVRQIYNTTHSDSILKILTDYLFVKKIGSIEQTSGLHNYISPNLSPIDAIEHITKRSVSKYGLPDFLFWETQRGFNFASLSSIMQQNPIMSIQYGLKNLAGQDVADDIYGARDIKVLSQFNMLENINSGSYAAKFIGYDILNRTIVTQEIKAKDIYSRIKSENANRMNSSIMNRDNKTIDNMFDSRVITYPFQESRKTTPWFQKTNPTALATLEDTHQYVLQRKMIFQNFMQRRLRVALAGNFGLCSGSNVQLNIPNNSNDGNMGVDKSLSGKYTITGTRHIIRADGHQTVIEVATDSTNLGT